MNAHPAPPSKSCGIQRRHFLAATALPLIGCEKPWDISGGFTGINHARGHMLRDRTAWPAPSSTRKTKVLILGGGVAGLAAARALRLKGQDDFALLELEDVAAGNTTNATCATARKSACFLTVPGRNAKPPAGRFPYQNSL